MNHKNKLRIARKLFTKEDKEENRTIFTSKGWTTRADAIRIRVARKELLNKKGQFIKTAEKIDAVL